MSRGTRSAGPTILAVAAATVAVAVARPAAAQGVSDLPPALKGVGVVERLDERLPLDLELTNEKGETVTLGRYFEQAERPVILTPVYYQCPMLCNLTLNGLVEGLNGIEWSAGEEFEIVTFSFNHEEEHELADVKKRAYLTQYTRPTAGAGWHFHVTDEETVADLCRAIGFGFKRDEKSGEYAHSSTIVFCTPDGRISRYMNDVRFEPRDLKYALIEASQGAIGSPMEKFVLFMCYRYDPDANSYVASAWKIMRLGGIATVILIAAGLTTLFLRGPRSLPAKSAVPAGNLQP